MDTKTTKVCSAPCVQLIGDDGKMFCEAIKTQFHQSDVIHVYVYPAGNGMKTVLHIMGDLQESKCGDPELVSKKI
jgi:nitrogenase molybdenum-iron protein alpha/beta subunit